MKVNIKTFFLFIVCSLAPLPIFFDLDNLSIIFQRSSLYDLDPIIPLPISFIFFFIVVFLNLPSILKKLSIKRFNLLLFLILILSLIIIINGAPIVRVFQIILPIIMILSIPGVVSSFTTYSAYAFVLGLSTFSFLHFFYYLTNINAINCTYNCQHIFLGYEIYHASVGFPDVVLFGISSSLILSQNKKDFNKQFLFIFLSFTLLFYAIFIARAATLLSIFTSIIIFSFIQFRKLLLTSKIDKVFLFSIVGLIIFMIFNGESIFSRLFFLYDKIFVIDGVSPRLSTYNYYLNQFFLDPLSIIFGGWSQYIGGHNYLISMVSIMGLFGLIILLKCYSIAIYQLSKSFKFKFVDLNAIQLFALTLSSSTIIVGNFVNDSITQPFNIIVMFVFFILTISLLVKKNQNLQIS